MILREELEKALRGLIANKAPGVYLIAAELLQKLGQAEMTISFELVYDMYYVHSFAYLIEEGKVRLLFLKLKFTTIANHRSIDNIYSHEIYLQRSG